MSEDFSLHLWTWYATDEYALVFKACGWMKALHFLHLPAAVQSSQIPYCPACETWSEMMLPVAEFLEHLPANLPFLAKDLNAVWLLCNELPEEAFRCDDFEMFYAPASEPLRSAAAQVLQRLGWEHLQTQIDDLESECRQKLFRHTRFEA